MKMKSLLSLLAAASLALSSAAFAAGAKTYQVTGPVLEVTDTMIAVQKGTDRWEVARDSNRKVTGELKVGATVTITYTMDATKVSEAFTEHQSIRFPGPATNAPALNRLSFRAR